MSDEPIKVGDKLAKPHSGFNGTYYTVYEVKRITATGRLMCTKDTVINPDMTIRGESKWSKVIRWTKELEELDAKAQKARQSKRLLNDFRYGELSDDLAIEMLKAVQSIRDGKPYSYKGMEAKGGEA